ncbi:hypothetical protein [Desulfovibrio inopinatus]|uniref:hypothetical protein n=1 Tax=Desulfovibrio inopinatus TaxID=102109 RepID=UPI00041BE4E0|nr:hypothetical protein [Desulfovibrio inopinatus]
MKKQWLFVVAFMMVLICAAAAFADDTPDWLVADVDAVNQACLHASIDGKKTSEEFCQCVIEAGRTGMEPNAVTAWLSDAGAQNNAAVNNIMMSNCGDLLK